MKNKLFIKEVKLIIYYIKKYGIDNCKFHLDESNYTKYKDSFIINVHIGFMKAQKSIIHNLINLEKEKKKMKAQLKESRRDRNKDYEKVIDEKINVLKHQEVVFRKLADSILWQLVGMDDTILKRLFCNNSCVDISNSNLNSDISVIDKIFENDKTSFPLLSDITSIVQIGDVIIRDYKTGKIGLIELKEGKVNEEIKRILDTYNETECEKQLYYNIKDKDDNFMKQFKRFITQKEKMYKTIETVNTGSGIDNTTGLHVKTPPIVIDTKHFDDDINDMLNEIKSKNYSIRVIDKCLLVGVYLKNKLPTSDVFDVWKRSCSINFRTIDYRESLYSPLAFPLFLNIFNSDEMIKIIKGDIIIKMTLDIDKWLLYLDKENISYRWMTKKETARLDSKFKGFSPFIHNDCALEISEGKFKSYLFDGIFSRIFYSFMKPTSAIYIFHQNFSNNQN